MTDDAAHDLTHEAAVHLRAAALEMIGAARALLDLTEQLVKDPGPIVTAVAALAAAAGRPVEPAATKGETDFPEGPDGSGVAGDARRPRPRVQHIRVS